MSSNLTNDRSRRDPEPPSMIDEFMDWLDTLDVPPMTRCDINGLMPEGLVAFERQNIISK